MLTPEQLSVNFDQDDTQSEFTVSYDSDEDEGPMVNTFLTSPGVAERSS
jgi:hypothetical protein